MARGLPRHWIKRHGAYYYRPPRYHWHLFDKKWVKLGKTIQEAHKTFSELPVHDTGDVYYTRDLAAAYALRVVPQYPAGTQANKTRSLAEIERVFGHIPVKALEPKHCYDYFDAKQGTRSARAVIEDLRHLFTKAVEWGILKRHPIKGQVVLKKQRPRNRYVTDDELIHFYQMASEKLRAYIVLKLLTGLSKQDMLCLSREDIQTDGLHAYRRKTNTRPKVYEWDDEGLLRRAINNVYAAHKGHVGNARLFHTRDGKPYYFVDENGHALSKPTSFDSMWQRLMTKWVESGGQRFTEHDIRAKSASDVDLEHARLLMDHSNSNITEKVYRRAPTVVQINKKTLD